MIEIISNEERVSGTVKKISFTYKGEEFRASLYWSEFDGYELIFPYSSTPERALNWEENSEESLAFILDDLTSYPTHGKASA